MNFMWDIVLKAREGGKREQELFFAQAQEYSPFYEQSFSCLNEGDVDSNVIELNLLFRFADIFQDILSQSLQELLSLEKEDFSEFRSYFIDAVLHTILFTDLRYGLTKRDIYIRKLTDELLNGTFWQEAAQEFRLISPHKQNRLATLVLTQMQTGSSLIIFRRSILVLYPDAMLYQIKADRKKLLLYLKEKETDMSKRVVQFVRDMFLPISYDLRVFWEYHFGIIGVEATMEIDKIGLY